MPDNVMVTVDYVSSLVMTKVQSDKLWLETVRMEASAFKVLNLARGTEHEDCARAAYYAAQRISDAALPRLPLL